MLFAQVLERYLDPLIVEFLIVSTKLVTAASGAIEELGHLADWRMWLSFELGCAADVNGAIEIEIINVLKDLADQQPWHRLVANTQYFGARANWGYVLVTPANLIIEA